jgi:hypothetical protein
MKRAFNIIEFIAILPVVFAPFVAGFAIVGSAAFLAAGIVRYH